MKVISRVQFPQTDEIAPLYIKYDSQSLEPQTSESKIFLKKGSTLSLNTYFNSIYENFYKEYTTLSTLSYLLKLEGDFAVAIYQENQVSEKKLIDYQTFQQCQNLDYVKIVLPELQQSRTYLEVTCLSTQGWFTEGLLVTEQQQLQNVSLAIIICTYKKEAFVKRTVNAILQDKLLQDKQFKIFIVDNAKTLEQGDFFHPRVQFISNRNVGGSGGFTKGLIEALQEGGYTHFLFMDDDIELDSEVIYRIFSLYEYAQQDFAVAGSMLDLHNKHILHEAGALYNQGFDQDENLQHRPFILTSLKHHLDLRNSTALNSLLTVDNIDFGGFYFFCFSQTVVEKIGLPLPFFIKIDDIEFSLRVKQLNTPIVAFPSLCVWHELSYSKKPDWDAYYTFRNMLITNSIHDSTKYLDVIKILTMGIVYHLLLFNYNAAQMYIRAFEDYMQGPDFLKTNDPESLHIKVCEFSKSHTSQTIVQNPSLNDKALPTTVGTFQKLLSLLTLNGHLLPPFLIRNESALIRYGMEERDSICKGFAKKRVIFVIDQVPHSYQNELDNQAGIYILFSWVKSVVTNRRKWLSVTREWNQAANDFTSINFWQDYLKPSK